MSAAAHHRAATSLELTQRPDSDGLLNYPGLPRESHVVDLAVNAHGVAPLDLQGILVQVPSSLDALSSFCSAPNSREMQAEIEDP
jgi:hypothetical protein